MHLRIREFRRHCGLSQADLATQASCSREMISAIERGRSSPTVDLLEQIAQALRVPVWTLLAEDAPAETRAS